MSTTPLNPPRPAPALVGGSVGRTLFRMAVPLLAGTFALNAYNLTDTWFVSRLGTLPLAAMGFTHPIVMLLTCVAMGLGTGVTALMSHAMGRHAHDEAARTVTHGIALMVVVSILLAILGVASLDTVFSSLGADAAVRPLIGDYMRIWYAGAFTMALPMLGNGLLIASGDSKAAGFFMMLGPVLNAILDPILIFGWLGCPPLGMQGAALATVLAQAASAAWLYRLLKHKHRLIRLERLPGRIRLAVLQRILKLGLPAILSMILMPLSGAVMMRFIGAFGNEAVAAAGAAGRLEMVAFVIPMALGISLTPFVSQNFGAGRLDRLREAFSLSTRFSLLYGAGIALLFLIAAPALAALFTRDPAVASVLVAYLRIIAFGYGMMEIHRYCGFFFTGLHKPVFTTLLTSLRILALLIPLAWIGMRVGGIRGLFAGRLATDLLAGGIGLAWVHRRLAAMPDRGG